MTEARSPDLPILLVDDEELMLRSVSAVLLSNGMSNFIAISDAREVVPTLARQEVEFVLLDLVMPHISGQELLEVIARDYPDVPVVIATAVNDVATAVECMKKGAFDYIVKPVEEGRLLSSARHAIELRSLRRENEVLRESLRGAALKHPEAFSDILTNNKGMLSVCRYLEAIAGTSQPVLITGATGVGKELAALAVHRLSERSGEFVPVNVAGLDDNLFADTLFGHVKGSYTGAHGARGGLVEKASGGTLFLDEIGDLSVASQVKLLRLLQEREYLPLGADDAKRTDARIVVATSRDLTALQEDGSFRKDLYYRLRLHCVHIPPLRERLDDLPLLVDHFLEEAAKEMNRKKPTLPGEVFSVLGAYHFPGNVRELRALVFDAVSKHVSGVLSLDTFRAVLSSSKLSGAGARASLQFGPQLPTIKGVRILLVREAMRRANNNQSVASRLLGITRQGLNKFLKNIELD